MTSGRKAIMPSSRCTSSASITIQQETLAPDFMAPITWLRVQRSFAAVVVRTVTSEDYHCSVLTGVFPRLVTRMVHECVTNVATDEVGWRSIATLPGVCTAAVTGLRIRIRIHIGVPVVGNLFSRATFQLVAI